MAKTRPPYTPEFRGQMVELVRAGRSPEELAQEFEPTAQSIRNWVGQAECDVGRGGSGLTTAEREELNQLRRENRQLRLERDILHLGTVGEIISESMGGIIPERRAASAWRAHGAAPQTGQTKAP